MCTIADAKVRQNYNCYNVYFNECLPDTAINQIKQKNYPERVVPYTKKSAAYRH